MALLHDIEIIALIFFLLFLWFITGIYMANASSGLHGSRNINGNLHSAYYDAFWGAFITLGLFSLAVVLVVIVIVLVIFFPEVLALGAVGGEAAEGAEVGIEGSEAAIEGAEEGIEGSEAAIEGAEEGEAAAKKVAKKVTKKGEEETHKTEKKKSKSWIDDIIYLFFYGAAFLLTINGILAVLCAINIDSSGMKSSVGGPFHDAVIAAVLSLGTIGVMVLVFLLSHYLSHRKQLELNIQKLQSSNPNSPQEPHPPVKQEKVKSKPAPPAQPQVVYQQPAQPQVVYAHSPQPQPQVVYQQPPQTQVVYTQAPQPQPQVVYAHSPQPAQPQVVYAHSPQPQPQVVYQQPAQPQMVQPQQSFITTVSNAISQAPSVVDSLSKTAESGRQLLSQLHL
jgi:hypothetical protein